MPEIDHARVVSESAPDGLEPHVQDLRDLSGCEVIRQFGTLDLRCEFHRDLTWVAKTTPHIVQSLNCQGEQRRQPAEFLARYLTLLSTAFSLNLQCSSRNCLRSRDS